MKLDDRDIICEQDYTTLSNAELVTHIETYARLMHSTPLSDGEWLDDIIGPARALMARAEAAETERNRLQRELSAAVTRVAELKADYAEENRLRAEAEAEQRANDAETERGRRGNATSLSPAA